MPISRLSAILNTQMPIIEQPAQDAFLSQGDILRDINLFYTSNTWAADCGEPKRHNKKMCLVLSRPCVAAHKSGLTVLLIEQYTNPVPKDVIDTTEKLLKFLESLRDGNGSPDLFYLGELPGATGKFAARFDSIHQIEIPAEASELHQFVKAKRIGKLNSDFLRDLHVRHFKAFTSMGFDDIKWHTTDDLKWITQSLESELAQAQLVLSDQEKNVSASAFSTGKAIPANVINKSRADIAAIQQKIDIYRRELDSRMGAVRREVHFEPS